MTDWKWHIFVSHSTSGRDDSPAAQLRDRLKAELTQHHYEVEIDKRFIAVGDPSEEEIRRALRRAHLGIVLLDQHAMASNWVRRETDYLWLNERFLIPVLIDVTRKDLEDNKELSFLNKLHQITLSSVDLNPVDDGMRQIHERLAPLTQTWPRPVLRWIRRVTKYFPDLSENGELEEFFGHNDQPGKKPPFHAKEWLALSMLKARINPRVVDLIWNLRDHLITKFGKDGREEFLTLLEPTWIDPDHASEVVRKAVANPVCMTMALKAIHVHTAEQYVRRGTQWDDRWYQIFRPDLVPDAEGRPYQKVDLEESVRHLLGSDPSFTQPIEYDPDRTHYLVLHADPATRDWSADVEFVHGLCEKIIIVIQVNTAENDWAASAEHIGELVVLKAVDPDVERQVVRRIREIRKVLRCERNTVRYDRL